MLTPADNYPDLYRNFEWKIPEFYNIGHDVCDKWAEQDPNRIALYHRLDDGSLTPISYGSLREQSNQLANCLQRAGLKPEDRVALLLPQCPQTLIAHIALYKLGAIAVPIAMLFGEDALDYRLRDSGAKMIITAHDQLNRVNRLRGRLPELTHCLSIDEGSQDADLVWQQDVVNQPTGFDLHQSRPDDPALMIYTSGTTGRAKGALHGHRVLLGHLPGVQMPHNFLPQEDDLFWTPSDWAWAGGLLNCLLPCLHFGVPVIAYKFPKFDAEAAFALMDELKIRNTYMPPTAIRMLKQVRNPSARYNLVLRSFGSGGESLGKEVLQWAQKELGITINESYGQTECNLMLGSCAEIGVSRPGAIGKQIPGHRVAIIDDKGQELPANSLGNIAVHRPNPVMFLRYWNNDKATQEKFIDDWLLTGDQGYQDEDGYIFFVGRDDDVINSAGYRIGPGEIEDCLTSHPAVALCAVVGKADPERTQIVKAYIVLQEDEKPSETLTKDIQHFVKTRLAAHEYPREISYLRELPMTTTGKIIRRKLKEDPRA
ncbi:acyl-CoA synthetase [Cohaesibacter gelatinilyticus]|uniref:Acetyl-CoA synthetase n=1 Tax=Cohaesibacter gelatinilyticus TaxID=372072 RepID=A0A285PIF5_9HYPH|nr:acyl-CoA synthetase [Cohaesibacter gelatinilyticus]SNZ21509.1 acetyl-CoA synthetase [Cohaesibacter gelatinilyticus]